MEEKVEYILQIIDEDGDSFARRAEMYYRKRPEIVNFVEDSFRGYRALADRYDHLSRELQSANRTIATVFPEQVQLAMDAEDEESIPTITTPSYDPKKPSKNLPAAPNLSIPKIPKISPKNSKGPSRLMSKKGLLKKSSVPAIAATTSSGMSKAEALEEIDELQKRILAFQTEKEFVKSSYETGLAKYWEIEKQVTEMQAKVSSLQDEFGIGTVIDDDEARALMSATALKSCQEALVRLQEKQRQSTEEARAEYQRIKEAHEKFETLKEQLSNHMNQQDISEKYASVSTSPELKNLEKDVDSIEQERHDLEVLRANIKEQLQVNSSASLTMSELAEKIDEVVEKVITIETEVSSQIALVKRLRSESNELQAHLWSLEEDKEVLIEGSDSMSSKIRELEEEFCRVQNLKQNVKDQNEKLQIHFTEGSFNLNHLSENLKTVKPDEEVQKMVLFTELRAVPGGDDMTSPDNDSKISKDVKTEEEQSTSVKAEEENFMQSNVSNHLLDLLREVQERATLHATPEKGFKRNEDMMAPGHDSVISKEVRNGEEAKEDDILDHSTSVKAEEENFVLSSLSNHLDNLLVKGQVRAVLDANLKEGSKECEDIVAPGHSIISKDAKTEEEEKKDVIPGHRASIRAEEVNFYQSNPSNHFDDLSRKCEVRAGPDAITERRFNEHEEMMVPGYESMIFKDAQTKEEEKKDGVLDHCTIVKAEEKEKFVRSNPSNHLYDLSEKGQESKKQEKNEKQDLFQAADSDLNIEPQELGAEDEDQPNWRQLFLNGLEDREKFLLEEYTSILKNFKEVKKKLSEVEKKNRDSLLKSGVQIKELKNANALKDVEIQSLHKKLTLLQGDRDETLDTSLTDFSLSQQGGPHESIVRGASFRVFDISSPNSDQKQVTKEEVEGEKKAISVDEPAHAVSTIEETIRSDIDGLLEENIEFWLRFSTSFHQIQKFQTSVQDLQEELTKLKENKKQDGSTKHRSLNSDVRPIYKHLRDIQTELALWLEHDGLLKDDLQNRLSSLSNIQEEISRLSNVESELSDYEAAKFQGEVLNMKQENNKVANELQAGLECVKRLQVEIERTLSKLEEELGISASKNTKNSSTRSRIPLRSFLFGVKLKKQKQKQSMFACMSPALQKQHSDLSALQT